MDKSDDDTEAKDHTANAKTKKPRDRHLHPAPLARPPAHAINPEDLPAPEKLAIDGEDLSAFLDHFHQHPDKPDLTYDAPPPG
jgi:hypothetical protein